MAKRDLEELFAVVKTGDAVEIRGERDEQTAAIFGGESEVAMAQSTTAGNESAGQ